MIGTDPNGTWTVEISDDAAGNTGLIDRVQLGLGLEELSTTTADDGTYSFAGLANGTYFVRTLDTDAVSLASVYPSSAAVAAAGRGTGTADFAALRLAEVGGGAFDDRNGNGAKASNEPLLGGRVVFADLDGDGVRDAFDSTFTRDANVAIPDDGVVTSTLAVAGVPGVILDLDVALNITHEFDADLDVVLITPQGRRIALFNDVGSSGDHFTGTVLDDEAANGIASGSAPFAGSFRPRTALSTADWYSADGDWKLEVTDDSAGGVGTLVSWSLRVKAGDPSTVTDGQYARWRCRRGRTTSASSGRRDRP